MYVSNSVSLHMMNNTFYNNTAPKGGGVLVEASILGARPVISILDSTFEENKAWQEESFNTSASLEGEGGAIATVLRSAVLNIFYVELIGCVFRNNTALRDGGAVAGTMMQQTTDSGNWFRTEIRDCLFVNNLAFFQGGGLYIDSVIQTVLNDNSFIGNTALGDGGLLWHRFQHLPELFPFVASSIHTVIASYHIPSLAI